MNLTSRAPTRIDLAGGTLDIWPLYLLVNQSATVNVAIDLYAEARVESAQKVWRVEDLDSGRRVEVNDPRDLEKHPGAEIAGALVRHFAPAGPLSIQTQCLAPPRSGLGASSAMGIAVAGALNTITGFRYKGIELIDIVKNIEVQILGVMTGAQDHYPSVFGGANCLWWGLEGVRRETLPLDVKTFEDRFLLAYTHQPHRSGVNNWEVIKRFIDGEKTTREALERIGEVAVQMRDSLLDGDFDGVSNLVKLEWEARRCLAPEVSCSEAETILDAALSAGADAGKACGAGGGGCLLIALKPQRRRQVEDAIRRKGGSIIPFRVAPQGLRLGND